MGGGDDSILVVMNSADHEVLLDSLEPGFMPATPLHPLFGIDGLPASASLDAQGRVTLRLPSRAGWVWRIGNRVAAHAGALAVATVGSSILGADGRLIGASPPIVLEPLPQREQSGDFTLRGQARPGRGLRLVLDGNLATARTLRMDAEGRFEARISTADMIDPAVTHRVLVVDLADLAGGAVSNALSFRVQPP